MRLKFCFLICILMPSAAFSFFDPLPDPDHVKVSLLSVDVGSGLEKRYGHTILRVSDAKSGDEYLLNWGTFDFSQPYYVPRFLKGLLRYWVAESTFYSTIRHYHEFENRSVYEDNLMLTTQQKARLLKILDKKLQPDAIYFWYDFFYNNCSTIPRDILNETLGGNILKHYENVPATMNLRAYVRRDLSEWAFVAFFLDIMLNSDVDAPANAWIEMFHPLMLQRYLSELPQYDDSGKAVEGTKLLTNHHTVVKGGVYPNSSINLHYIVLGLGLAVLLLAFLRKKWAPRLLGSFSIAWGLFSGLVGSLLVSGWLFSNHHMLYHNANLFLFWPMDFAFVYLGLKLIRKQSINAKKWKLFTYAHLVSLGIFVGCFVAKVFTQDVSNVVYYLAPVAALFFLMTTVRSFLHMSTTGTDF